MSVDSVLGDVWNSLYTVQRRSLCELVSLKVDRIDVVLWSQLDSNAKQEILRAMRHQTDLAVLIASGLAQAARVHAIGA